MVPRKAPQDPRLRLIHPGTHLVDLPDEDLGASLREARPVRAFLWVMVMMTLLTATAVSAAL